MGIPNWGNLVARNRAKGVGVPWSKEDMKALYEYKIPADYVRQGITTLEAYNYQRTMESSPLFTKPLKEIREIAKSKGIEFLDEAPKELLITLIQREAIIEAKKEVEIEKVEEKKPIVKEEAKVKKVGKKVNKK